MEETVRNILKRGIRGESAHLDPSTVLEGLSFDDARRTPPFVDMTIWHVALHMHFWVSLKVDLFEGKTIEMPGDHHFPPLAQDASVADWERLQHEFKTAISRIGELLETIDLNRRYPVWENLTAAEIVQMMVNHNSYHAAQVVGMRRQLGAWNERS